MWVRGEYSVIQKQLLFVEIYQTVRSEQMAAADRVVETSTNQIVDSLSVSVRPKKKKKKMEGKEECEMLEKVYRPLGSSAETDRRLKFKS